MPNEFLIKNGFFSQGNSNITGSLTVSPSGGVELNVTSTGVTIGNAVLDSHRITGSFDITGSAFNVNGGNLTLSGSLLMSGSIQRPVFLDYEEVYTSPSISTNTLTLNLNNGNIFNVALNADINTLTITNPPTTTNAGSFVIIFTADGTPRSVTCGGSIKWPSGAAPSLTSTNGKVDILSFVTINGGTTWYGFVGGQNL